MSGNEFDRGFDSEKRKKIILSGLLHNMEKKRLSEKEAYAVHQLKKGQKVTEANKLTSRQLKQAVKRNRRAIHAKRNRPLRDKKNASKPAIILVSAVASVLLILLAFNLYYSLQQSSISEKEMVLNQDEDIRFTTDKNMKRITLADGSTVHLNRGSTVSLKKGTFNAHTRELWLEEGEAFFEIKRDVKRPFIVHTNNGVSTHVLGTSFNIKSYEELSYQEISVVSGKVQVENNHSNKIILEPNYKVAVSDVDGLFTPAKTNSRAIAQWRTGSIVFQEAPIAEVAFRVKQYYDMEVVYDLEDFKNDRIYTQFTPNTSLEEVAIVISKLTNATYKIDDKGITMYKK